MVSMLRRLRASLFRFSLYLLADHPPTTEKPKKSRGFLRSGVHACRGLIFLFMTERNFRLECYVAVFALALGLVLRISALEWALIIFNIAFVLSSEAKNTAVEMVTDLHVKAYDYNAKGLKDVSSGSVLLASLSAAATGFLIFGPRLIALVAALFQNGGV